MKYVAFLRGINVGGHKPIKMAELRAAFEAMGFQGVRTLQTSGNVVFRAETEEDVQALTTRVEAGLRVAFHSPVGVHLRTLEELQALVASDPFRDVPLTVDTRLYVTFISTPADDGTVTRREEPRTPPSAAGSAGTESAFRLVKTAEREVLTAITLSPRWGTTELMGWLEKEFGSGVTTRSWNTIRKIVETEVAS